MDNNTVEWVFHAKQTKALAAWLNPSTRRVLFGGAKGGGKSVFGCRAVYLLAVEIIKYFDLKPTDYPVPVGFMGRMQGIDFSKTTLETWKNYIPRDCYRIRYDSSTSGEIIIGEAVKVLFGGLDKSEKINKFNSAEFIFVFIDQAEEVPKDTIGELEASKRRKINGKEFTHYPTLFTANPAQCWLKSEFIEQKLPGDVFIPSLPKDNPFLKKGYSDDMRRIWKHHPELLEAYLEGSWDAHADADQIIRASWLREARLIKRYPAIVRKFLVCDVARFGDDETVIMLFEETAPVKAKMFTKKDTMFTAAVLHRAAIEEKCTAVVIDADGVGGGVADRLTELSNGQYSVIQINSAGKPDNTELYVNVRAEMWDTASGMLQGGDVELRQEDTMMDQELCTPKYKFRNGKMMVEPKEEIKKRLGRSPNRADALVMGLYCLPRIPVGKQEKESGRKRLTYLGRHKWAASAMSA